MKATGSLATCDTFAVNSLPEPYGLADFGFPPL